MTTPAPGTLAWFEVAARDPDGAPAFAYLREPSGNQFGIFTPPAT